MMMEWMQTLFPRRPQAPVARPRQYATAVYFDDKMIRVVANPASPRMGTSEMPWSQLGDIAVRVSWRDESELDLTWIISSRDGQQRLTIPMGAQGERAFTRVLQERAHGLDRMAVLEALSAVSDGEYHVWPPRVPR